MRMEVAAERAASAESAERRQQCADLLAVARHQDRAAFARLFDRYAPLIKCFSLAGYPGALLMAEEVTQETMLKVWRKAHTYKPETAAVSTWVFTLARNCRIDYLRKNSRHQSDIDPDSVWSELVDESADPFLHAQQKRLAREVRAGVGALPAHQQQVLGKVYMEGKSHSEVAAELGIPLGTVKSRLSLALKKLAVTLERP